MTAYKSCTIIDLLRPGLRAMKKEKGYEKAVEVGMRELGVRIWWPKKAKEIAKLLIDYTLDLTL